MEKKKTEKEDVQQKVTVIINQNTRRYKKGQKVQVTEEIAEIFKGKGLIDGAKKEETLEEKALKAKLKQKKADELVANKKTILKVIEEKQPITKKDVVLIVDLEKEITNSVMELLVKEGIIVMSDKNEYSVK